MNHAARDGQVPDVSGQFDHLSLFPPEQLARWRGLAVHWLRTPEGAWKHRFTPDKTVVSFLETGRLRARLSVLNRSTDADMMAGAFALFNPDLEVRADQVGCDRA